MKCADCPMYDRIEGCYADNPGESCDEIEQDMYELYEDEMEYSEQDEWESKPDDWRKGWRYGQGDTVVTPIDSQEFRDGYLYAINNPMGSCYSVNATTGNK